MHILRTIKDGRSTLMNLVVSTYLNWKKTRKVIVELVDQCPLKQK